jgi:plastocyanin
VGRSAWVLVVAAVSLFPSTLPAGTLQGRLLTTPVTAQRKVRQPSSDDPVDVPQRGVGEAVVYLDRIPDEVERKLTSTHWWKRKKKSNLPRIVQADLRFSPRVLVAPVGTQVEFANLDRVFHNTFSVSAARRFDLGRYLPGHVDTVTFDRAGVANLHCDIHPQEVGFVVVVPNHAYARPDSLGYFTLPKLSAGDYVVRVWHPRLGDLRRKVTMPRRGNLRLDLKL